MAPGESTLDSLAWGIVYGVAFYSLITLVGWFVSPNSAPWASNPEREHAWAQREVQKLTLPEAEKARYTADLAVARSGNEADDILNQAKYHGDADYRSKVDQQRRTQTEFEHSWLGQAIMWFVAGAALLALLVQIWQMRGSTCC
jgi:cytochrome oxidase assembly protein ShyY1